MIIVREIFVAKPGMASKLARMFKEMEAVTGDKTRVFTDVTGNYNNVVMETQYENLAEFERRMKEYSEKTDKEMTELMKGYTDMYLVGRREIFKEW